MIGGFGGPDRNDSVEDTGSPAVDKTSHDHPVGVHSGGLKGSTDDGPYSTERDCLDTSIFVTEPAPDETTHKSANVIDGDLGTRLDKF